MPKVAANGIEIEYESFGAGDPLLLVMGLGMQLIAWPEEFCAMLVARGYRVIRFDNRDVGLSTIFESAGAPGAEEFALAVAGVGAAGAPYDLSDMAADIAGLLDALDIERAHVVGASMGGMIGQTLAIEHPSRVRTLTSIMSTTGDPQLLPIGGEAFDALTNTPPADVEGAVANSVSLFRLIGSPGYEMDTEMIAVMARLSYERRFAPHGAARQLLATLVSGDRTAKLAAVKTPTLVLHGEDDPLLPLACGVATAEAIPGARLRTFPGMGHDFPRELWTEFVDEIDAHAKSARA